MKVQRQIILMLLPLILQIKIFGQKFPSHVGVKGGINVSGLTKNTGGPFTSDYNARIAPNFEVFIETKVSNLLTFQSAGLEFSAQGAKKRGFQPFRTPDKYSQSFPAGQVPKYLYANFEKELKFNYVFLTTILRVSTNATTKRVVRPYVTAGFFIGYLVSTREISRGSGIVYKDIAQTQPLTTSVESLNDMRNSKDDLHKFNVGVNGSIGFTGDINKIRIYIEGGGNYGFININKQVKEGKTHIKSMSGRIGFSYHIGQMFPGNF